MLLRQLFVLCLCSVVVYILVIKHPQYYLLSSQAQVCRFGIGTSPGLDCFSSPEPSRSPQQTCWPVETGDQIYIDFGLLINFLKHRALSLKRTTPFNYIFIWCCYNCFLSNLYWNLLNSCGMLGSYFIT